MVLEIITLGDPVLRRKCQPVEHIDGSVSRLAEDMIETMYAADGIGLAAPQVGVSLQVAVVDVPRMDGEEGLFRLDGENKDPAAFMPLVMVNPVLDMGAEKESQSEGCLSIPEVRGNVLRPLAVTARYTALDGARHVLECDGLLARAIQHEVDHLNGILFVDRMSAAAKLRIRRALRDLAREPARHRYIPAPSEGS